MDISLSSYAEQRAEAAESLHAFSGIKLLHVKRELAELLKLIGRDGFFSTYTGHDISHVNEMLSVLDWLIPEETKASMSPADWLLIVLAIYFHDVGMIVTEKEYDQRDQTEFKDFKSKVLSGGLGVDYLDKIKKLGPDREERFIYQEYVRNKHPERAKNWLLGRAASHLLQTSSAATEIARLIQPADAQFVADLATVCESHHLNDLGDISRYPLRRAYGNSEAQTANVQYAAILLRTTDLLHITRDRTPSVIFNAINVTDPVSQEEWAKQKAVRRVRPKPERDADGRIDENIPKDTIEVHATFAAVDGFFGLTSYLAYVADQLKMSFVWAEHSNRNEGISHQFPWRKIDDREIIATGFLKQSFEFTIDQGRILDLLTGHTLYNDSTVVLRELAQNSLDAVRLQHHIDKSDDLYAKIGSIHVTYSTKAKLISICDHGTGMTQEIIENHFLKVGSSRYQDPEFRKQFPGFSAISRFGIGVLSAFMIADTVEVVTCHPKDKEARHLTLKSVHGKYLIRLLDKLTDPIALSLTPHGTRITLQLRASASSPDVLRVMQNWILFPGCNVTVQVDDGPVHNIGFDSPKTALEFAIAAASSMQPLSKTKYKVEQVEAGGLSLAYGVVWSEYFNEWSFLKLPDQIADPSGQPQQLVGVGMCIGGVRVETATPGFSNSNIAAIANATGSDAPRTNVARSRLEVTEQWDKTVKIIYNKLCSHVSSEAERMQRENGHSLTWAAQEVPFLMQPLTGEGVPTHPKLLKSEIAEMRALLVEFNGDRLAMSPSELSKHTHFWTIDCEFFNHAESLMREVQSNASLHSLITSLHASGFDLPNDPVLCNISRRNPLVVNVMANREVDVIRIHQKHRRVDLRWVNTSHDERKWRSILDIGSAGPRRIQILVNISNLFNPSVDQNDLRALRVLSGDIDLQDTDGYHAVATSGQSFLFGPKTLTTLLGGALDRASKSQSDADFDDAALAFALASVVVVRGNPDLNIEKFLHTLEERIGVRSSDHFPLDLLKESFSSAPLKTFNALAWRRPESLHFF